MGDILNLLLSTDPWTPEQVARLGAQSAAMLRVSLAATAAVTVWAVGGFFLRRRSRRGG